MDKTVFITGSSSGIGEQTAYEFAKRGWNIVITYHMRPEDGQRVWQACRKLGAAEVLALELDVSDDNSIAIAVKNIVEKFGKIDVLINNAAVMDTNNLAEQDSRMIDEMIDVNFRGLVKLTKEALPYVKQSIINVASNLGLAGRKRMAVYSATKFAVRGFTQSLAGEVPNLLVYAVNPGLTATRMGNFQGRPPARVAEIIWKAAEGKYKAPSGSDINVRDYIYGERLGKLVRAARFVKKLINS